MAEEYRERRRHTRMPCSYAVLLRKASEEDLGEPTRTSCLSLGGCRVASGTPLGRGTDLELLISLDLRPVSVPGRVVWERSRDDGRFNVGVEFTFLGHDERILLEQLLNQDVPPS